jgi:hypothetical protein
MLERRSTCPKEYRVYPKYYPHKKKKKTIHYKEIFFLVLSNLNEH